MNIIDRVFIFVTFVILFLGLAIHIESNNREILKYIEIIEKRQIYIMEKVIEIEKWTVPVGENNGKY